MPGDSTNESNPPAGSTAGDPYLDAADRLERTIDVQITTITEIDDKAEHVTRLVGLLIGLVFSVLSLVVNIDSVSVSKPIVPVQVSFVLGVLGLLLSMGAAIVTYLSSKFGVGLHQNVGFYLGNPATNVEYDWHIRRVLGLYGEVVEANRAVIETNSQRFRWSLFFLLFGLSFLTTAGMLYVSRLSGQVGWIGVGVAGLVVMLAGSYILTGKYLTIDAIGGFDD